MQRRFHADAATLVCVDGDTSQAAFCHLADLEVACLYPVCGEVCLEPSLEEVQVGAYLVVPRSLGLVVGRCSHVGLFGRGNGRADAAHNHVGVPCGNARDAGEERLQIFLGAVHGVVHHQPSHFLLKQIAEQLHVIPARAIAATHGGIDVAALAEVVLQGHFWQDMQVLVVEADACDEREVPHEFDGGLVEDAGVQRGCAEAAPHRHDAVLERDGHGAHALCGEVGQGAVDDGGQPVDAFLIECDGGFRAEPLVLEVDAAGPLPASAVLRLDGYLLAQHLAVLFLLEGEDVLPRVVLVHVHLVLQELEACDAAQHDAVEVVLCLEARAEVVSQIVSFAVVCHTASVVACLFCVGVCALACPLVTCGEVDVDALCGAVDASPVSCDVIAAVHAFIIACVVLEVAAQVLVADACAEGKVVGWAVVVRYARAIIIICSGSKHEVCALVVHGVLGVDAYESAHRVASVESPLRAPEHVDAVGVAQVLVHAAHVCQGDVVDVHAHGGRSDAAADAAQVDACGQTAAVGGDEEARYVCAQPFDAFDVALLQLCRSERSGGDGLAAEQGMFLGCADHHQFVHVADGE